TSTPMPASGASGSRGSATPVDPRKDRLGAGGAQRLGHTPAERLRIVPRAVCLLAEDGVAVRIADEAAQVELIAAALGVGPDGNLAAAVEMGVRRTLGGDALARFRMIEGREQRVRRLVVAARLDADRALRHRRQAHRRVELLADAVLPAEAFEPGDREYQCIELVGVELCEPRVHVAAEVHHLAV